MIARFFMFIMKIFGKAVFLMICLGLVFISYKANQPMSVAGVPEGMTYFCLLYTSDAADDLLCVDLGGRRIIKKKN